MQENSIFNYLIVVIMEKSLQRYLFLL